MIQTRPMRREGVDKEVSSEETAYQQALRQFHEARRSGKNVNEAAQVLSPLLDQRIEDLRSMRPTTYNPNLSAEDNAAAVKLVDDYLTEAYELKGALQFLLDMQGDNDKPGTT